MARRIRFTETPDVARRPGADPDGLYAEWAIVDDDEAVSGRQTVVQRDDHGRLTVSIAAEDSIAARHLRDLAESAIEAARRSVQASQRAMHGGHKSGVTRKKKAQRKAGELRRIVATKMAANPMLTKSDAIRSVLKRRRGWFSMDDTEQANKIKAALKFIRPSKKVTT